MTVRILAGHVLDKLADLPDERVQMCVTSPPYYQLRDYGLAPQTWPDGWVGSLGAEPSVALYIDHLVAVFAAVKRVLRRDGVLFVNLGDSYAGSNASQGGDGTSSGLMRDGRSEGARTGNVGRVQAHRLGTGLSMKSGDGLKAKDLMLVPDRFRIAMQDSGWFVRSKMPWVKRNCLSGGTRVYVRSQKGDMPMTIKDLARLDPSTVQLWNGDKWTQLVGIWESERPDDLLEIRLRSGEHIGCTADHRWPTQRGVVAASELRAGDVVQTTTLPGENSPHEPIGLDAERVGWFVGLYIAEGHRTQQSIVISGHIKEGGRFERLCELAAAYDGTCRVHHTGGNVQRVILSGPVLHGILGAYVSGEGAHRKHLTTRAWQRSAVFLRAVLDGYLSGDGHWDERNRRWRLGFCQNDPLADDIRTLCGRLGVSLRLNRCQHQLNGRKIPGWRGQIRFDREDRTPAWGGFRLAEDGEVIEIGRSRARKVWDLTVADEPHLFALASGVLTHNCMPESVTDRPVTAVEDVILFTRSPRYFWDAEAVKRKLADTNQQSARTQPDLSGRYGTGGGHTGLTGLKDRMLRGDHGGRNFRNSDLFFDSLGLILDEAGDEPGAAPQPKPRKGDTRRGDRAPSSQARISGGLAVGMATHMGNDVNAGPDFEPLGLILDESGDPLALDVNPAGFKEAHFATFPPKLVRPLILAGTSEKGCCRECGSPWLRDVNRTITQPGVGGGSGWSGRDDESVNAGTRARMTRGGGFGGGSSETTGWQPSCKCLDPGPPIPCTVLDPFSGAGTTLLVSDQLGRDAIGIDLQPSYAEMSLSRVRDDCPLFTQVELA
jgi:DNA modification methylase